MSDNNDTSCGDRTKYRFGDQREDGMFFYARRHTRMTGIWLTEEAFRKQNGGKPPSNRKGRLRADGKLFYRGGWVSREVFDRLLEGEKVKRFRLGERKLGESGVLLAFAGYAQGKKENWMPEDKWIERQSEQKRSRALRKANRRAIQQPKVCGQFVRPNLIFVGEFTAVEGTRPTRVYFNCAQWKAALEGLPPPPELRRARLRAYWWLVRRLMAKNNE